MAVTGRVGGGSDASTPSNLTVIIFMDFWEKTSLNIIIGRITDIPLC